MPDQQQQRDNEFVTLRVPVKQAEAVRDVMRAHLTELPAAIRQDLQTQLSGWPTSGAMSGSTQSGPNRESHR